MAKLLLKDTTVPPLPAYIRKRFTLHNALLNTPQYLRGKRYERPKKKKQEVVIEEREIPKPVIVSETTQTKDITDAETNTKTTRGLALESKKSKIKSKCTSAWAKGARFATCSPYVDIARRLKQDLHNKHKKTTPAASDSKKELPGIIRRRGILKKVLEDVTLDGMCSTGTTTDENQPTLDRLLKENTIFLKYSKNCKSKKKRVRMEKNPVFSYFKRPERESSPTPSSEEGEPRQKRVVLADEHRDISSEPSEDDTSLERKPARLALRSSGDSDAVPDASNSGLCVISSSISNVSKAPSSLPPASEKLSRRQLQRQAPRLSVCAKPWPKLRKTPCRVPRERLYFKHMFSYFPGSYKR